MKPTVARMVHVVDHPPVACRAAVVTEVTAAGLGRGEIGVAILNPAGLAFGPVSYHEGHEGDPGEGFCGGRFYPAGTWHWPAREPEENR